MVVSAKIIRAWRSLVAVFAAFYLASSLAMANHLEIHPDGVAIQGYDTVAFFTLDRATKGQPEFSHEWDGATWWFARAEHRDMFASDPERYAPRFGGYCTGGLSLGIKRVADPENWYIVDGTLHLHHSPEGREEALADLNSTLAEAEENWVKFGGD